MARWQLNAIIALAAAAVVFGAGAVYTSVGVERVEKENPPSGRFVEVAGGRLHLVDTGPTDALAVVLLHGSSANLGDMQFALGERFANRYRVILVDRPGHGWSERLGGRDDAAPARQAKLIAEALERIGVRRPVLVAHSWGGAVALAYALAQPRDIAGLVLLAPLAYPRSHGGGWYTNLTTALLAQSARTAEAPIIGPLFAHTFVFPIGQLLLGWTVDSAFEPQEPPAGYIGKVGAELLLRPAEFIANGQDLAAIDRYLEEQARSYTNIATPTAIIAGDSDRILSSELQARRLAAALPRATLEILSGVGHMVTYAAPERVFGAVESIRSGGSR